MSHIAYKRVSTTDQKLDRQLADTGITFDKVFEDKCSGSTTNRPALTALIDYSREGDTVYVHDIDRMARSTKDLLDLIKLFNDKGITIVIHKRAMTFSGSGDDAASKLMLTMLSAVAEFELSMISERRAEGITKAKAKGVYKGGVHRKTKAAKEQEVLQLLSDGTSIRKTAAIAKVGVSTVQRIKKEASVAA